MRERCAIWLLLGLARVADAEPPPLPVSITAASHGSAITVRFKNRGARAIAIPVDAAGYDDRLTLTLTRAGEPPRTYAFRSPGTEAPSTLKLAAGAVREESFDVVAAALRANADPPPSGEYAASLVWVDGATHLAATTKLAIAAPVEGPCTSKPAASGIELYARQVPASAAIDVGLHNAARAPICVAVRIDADAPQSDWLSVELATTPPRTVRFFAGRHAAALVTAELAPGATVWTRWDLAAWSARDGLPALPRADIPTTLTYDTSRHLTAFHGVLTTRVTLDLR